jgi:hypothetical protein
MCVVRFETTIQNETIAASHQMIPLQPQKSERKLKATIPPEK